jgi:hypothetical protein
MTQDSTHADQRQLMFRAVLATIISPYWKRVETMREALGERFPHGDRPADKEAVQIVEH